MYKGKTIGTVVPAFNEKLLIGRTIDTIPEFVDRIIVVDDGSRDGTSEVVRERLAQHPDRIILIRHEVNRGVGVALASGYKWCRDREMDVAVRIDGDSQMNPLDLPALLDPVVEGKTDYAKGNRLFTGDAWNLIPRWRYLGNAALSLLTKIASGYWHVADSQSGYTATNLQVLKTINWDLMYPRYGQPNDLLVRLNIYQFRVRDVPVHPVYNIGEKSGVKPFRLIPRLSWLLFKLFLWRMKEKYVIRDFHPLLFFYLTGMGLMLLAVPLAIRLVWMWITTARIPPINALALMFSLVMGFQFLFFAMWFDMDYNRGLR